MTLADDRSQAIQEVVEAAREWRACASGDITLFMKAVQRLRDSVDALEGILVTEGDALKD